MDETAAATDAPLFCRRCRRGGGAGERLCPECGDALRPRGYCPVCEDWTFAGTDEPCPKHDVDLLDRPAEAAFDPSMTRLVTVASFGLPAEAHGPRLRLEAEGIPAFLQGQRMGDHAIYGVATGGVKLQVAEEFADDARVLLAQTWTTPKADEPDPDDPWEGLGPDPAEGRRSVMKVAILLFLFGPLVFSLVGILLMALGRR